MASRKTARQLTELGRLRCRVVESIDDVPEEADDQVQQIVGGINRGA